MTYIAKDIENHENFHDYKLAPNDFFYRKLGTEAAEVVYLCPCGLDTGDMRLPIVPAPSGWNLTLVINVPTITPSVNTEHFGSDGIRARCHYYITNGTVVWCEPARTAIA